MVQGNRRIIGEMQAKCRQVGARGGMLVAASEDDSGIVKLRDARQMS